MLDGRQQLAQIGLHLLGRPAGSVDQLARLVLAVDRAPERGDRQLRAEPRVHHVSGAHVDDVARRAQLARLGDTVPDDRRHAPGAVADHQLQVLPAVAPALQLEVADQHHLGDLATICEFTHLHHAAKIEWRADGNFPWIAAQSSLVERAGSAPR